jgi:hypothetical protein
MHIGPCTRKFYGTLKVRKYYVLVPYARRPKGMKFQKVNVKNGLPSISESIKVFNWSIEMRLAKLIYSQLTHRNPRSCARRSMFLKKGIFFQLISTLFCDVKRGFVDC